MLIEKHSFEGGMNGDLSPRLIPQNECLNLMNCRMAISQFGRTLRIENLPGTTIVPQTVFPIYGSSQIIGSAQDLDNNRLLFFMYNTFNDHGIFCYDPATNKIYAVIYDA